MNAKTILFPTDFSDCSSEALEYATSLAKESGGKLLIVHAEESFVPFGGEDVYAGLLEEAFEDLQKELDQVVPTDPTVDYARQMLRGSEAPAKRIVKYATKEKVDLIVMGTHGRTGLNRMLLGSVAEAVVRHAPCPVLLVKQGSTKPAAV